MTRKLTYADAGVDRELRAESKKALRILERTYGLGYYGKIIKLPYGNVFPLGEGRYLDLIIEGVGTKVLIAQLAKKYATIGVDGVAVAVNDVIRSGARPLAIADNIHAQVSDPALIKELMKGVTKGAIEAECPVPSGEIGDVSELIKGLVERKGFDIIMASIGEVTSEKVILGTDIMSGDVIIGLRSTGLHSNGISLARRILFKQWGGRYEPCDILDGFDRELVDEALEPTKIYVKPMLRTAGKVNVKAAVHITGDAYLKFGNLAKFTKGIGFEFNNFNPQPIFDLIQKTAMDLGGKITDEEMLKTYNMGWGFALIVEEKDADSAIDILGKSGTVAERIGRIIRSKGIRILYKNKKILLN